MKYFVLTIALLCIAAPASAQTPVPKETADKYLQNCMAKPIPDLSASGQKSMCACQASRLPVYFTVEEWNTMIGQDPTTARVAYNTMLTNIYAPCMEEPTREMYYKMCADNPATDQTICKCTADGLAAYMKTNGGQVFGEILEQDPMTVDPMAVLERNANFQKVKEEAAKTCAGM